MAKNICRVSQVAKDGLNRDVLIRFLICKEQFWWKTVNSPWKLNIEHDWVEDTVDPKTGQTIYPYRVNDLRERAMNLCGYELTHSNFGLSYLDLMKLDLATFEEIEERVHDLAKEQAKSMEKFTNAGKEAKNNLLHKGK